MSMTTERDASGITLGPWRWLERTRDEAACLVAGATTLLHGYTDEHGEQSGIIIENPKDADAIELVPEMIAALRGFVSMREQYREATWNNTLGNEFWNERWESVFEPARRLLAQLDNADAPRIAD